MKRVAVLILIGLLAIPLFAIPSYVNANPGGAKLIQNNVGTQKTPQINSSVPTMIQSSRGGIQQTVKLVGDTIPSHVNTNSHYYTYITTGGNYSFAISSPFILNYTSRDGNKSVSFSTYVVLESGIPLLPVSTIISENHPYKFGTNTTLKTFGGTIHGYLSQVHDFSITPEKTTVIFTPTTATQFNIAWAIAGYDYISTDPCGIRVQASSKAILTTLPSSSSEIQMSSVGSQSDCNNYLKADFSSYLKSNPSPTIFYGRFVFNAQAYYVALIRFNQGAKIIDPTLIQQKNASSGTAIVSSVTCTLSSSVTIGDFLMWSINFAYTSGTPTVTSVTDSLDNTYTNPVSTASSGATVNTYVALWTTISGKSGSDVMTATFDTAMRPSTKCAEFSGVVSSTADATSSGSGIWSSGSTVSPSVTSFSPPKNDMLIMVGSGIGCRSQNSNGGSIQSQWIQFSGIGASLAVIDTDCNTNPYSFVINGAGSDIWYYPSWTGGAYSGNDWFWGSNTALSGGNTGGWTELIAAFPALPTSNLLQKTQNGQTATTSYTCTLSNSVNTQDLLMFMITLGYSSGTPTVTGVTDSLGNSFASAISVASTGATANTYTAMFTGMSLNGGSSDTLTATIDTSMNPIGGCAEFSGIGSATPDATSTGTGSFSSGTVVNPVVTSFTPPKNDLVIELIGAIICNSQASSSSGSPWNGFINGGSGGSQAIVSATQCDSVTPSNFITGNFNTYYVLSWSSGATTGTGSYTSSKAVDINTGGWTEVIATFPIATTTLPFSCTMANSSVTPTVTFSVLQGSVAPGSATCNGVQLNLTVPANKVIIATEPTDGTKTRERFPGVVPSSQTIITACGAGGTCSLWSITNYYQYILSGDISSSFSAARTTGGISSIITSPDWYDSGTDITVTGVNMVTWSAQTQPFYVYEASGSGGIQVVGNQTVNSVAWNNANSQVPFLTFTTTSQARVKGFIPATSGLNLKQVLNNQIVNTGATFTNNIVDETGASPHEWDFGVVSLPPNNQIQTPPSGGGGVSNLPPPVVTLQVTSTTATILGQELTLTYIQGDAGLIGFGIGILTVTLVIIYVGFSFNARRRKRRIYDPKRHF